LQNSSDLNAYSKHLFIVKAGDFVEDLITTLLVLVVSQYSGVCLSFIARGKYYDY